MMRSSKDRSSGTDPREDGVVEIEASAHVQELRLEREACTRTATTGDGRTTSRRDNLPEGGAEPGVTYTDVDVGVTIAGEIDVAAPRRSPT